MRTRVQNALQAIALGHGVRRGQGLWTRDGQAALAAITLPPYTDARLSSANIDGGRCSGCLWFKTILMMHATEDRRRCDSISSRKPMAS
jgi:hypothetical protein